MSLLRILHRVDQFRRAVFARVREEEIVEISTVLTPSELQLFLQMSVVDQRHSLDVYYTSLEIIEDYPDADLNLTKKAVLLHDLGKSCFKVSLMDRVLATLPKKLVQIFFLGKLSMYLTTNICIQNIQLKWFWMKELKIG